MSGGVAPRFSHPLMFLAFVADVWRRAQLLLPAPEPKEDQTNA